AKPPRLVQVLRPERGADRDHEADAGHPDRGGEAGGSEACRGHEEGGSGGGEAGAGEAGSPAGEAAGDARTEGRHALARASRRRKAIGPEAKLAPGPCRFPPSRVAATASSRRSSARSARPAS